MDAPLDASVADALPLFAPQQQVVAAFTAKESWPDGYWGEVTVTNPGTATVSGWSLTLFLPPGWGVGKSWNAQVEPAPTPQAGGLVAATFTATPSETWAVSIAPGASVTFGMVAGKNASGQAERDRTALRDPRAAAPSPAGAVFAPAIRGFNMGSWWQGTFNSPDSLAALRELAAAGANTVAIVPTQYVANINSPTIFPNQQTETDDNVIAMIREARRLGLKVMLKPHIHLMDFGLHQRIAPADTATFFREFERVMVHYATIAQAEKAEMMSLAGELVGMTVPKNEAAWRQVIAAVRRVYGGKLTYAANWGEEWQVRFWDALDYIGVDEYAPVAATSTPTVDDIVRGWTEAPTHPVVKDITDGLPLAESLRRLSRYWGKPVLFTEIGYRSIDGAATGKGDNDQGARDPEEQAIAYQGFLEAMARSKADWLAGVLFWQWPTQPVAKAPDPDGFSPAGKPAEAVVRRWFQDRAKGG